MIDRTRLEHATEGQLREALSAALEAIHESDPGPAYYQAKGALEEIASTLGCEEE